jgi:hypothetical protein
MTQKFVKQFIKKVAEMIATGYSLEDEFDDDDAVERATEILDTYGLDQQGEIFAQLKDYEACFEMCSEVLADVDIQLSDEEIVCDIIQAALERLE